MKSWLKRSGLLVAIAAVALAVGCAQERDAIDRVQPNFIKKAMLEGEWHFAEKIIDTPGGSLAGSGFAQPIVGWYSTPQRIFFDIQEEFLYIRRTTENILGINTYDDEWDPDNPDNSSAIVAAFRIDKHFDVQRAYNAVTGESHNVVMENSSDRPWYDRAYIRVDWSKNISPDFDLGYGFLSAYREPVNFYVQDECTPDLEFASNVKDRCVPDTMAPFFDVTWNKAGTELERGYFDITTVSVLEDTMYYPGFGEIPGCWFSALGDCSDLMYFHRNAFWKILPEQHDYEPMPYKGAITNQIGFFERARYRHDMEDGTKNQNKEQFAVRHNIWEQTHTWNDPRRETTLDLSVLTKEQMFNPAEPLLCRSTTDCCTSYKEDKQHTASTCRSTCDVYSDLLPEHRKQFEKKYDCKFHVTPSDLSLDCDDIPVPIPSAGRREYDGIHYCTLPYDERRVRPMVYYTNDKWPEELVRRPGEKGTGEIVDDASSEAFRFAYIDDVGEAIDKGVVNANGADAYLANYMRSVIEQVSDQWNAPMTRSINILKRKASGDNDVDSYANVPEIDDEMYRLDPVDDRDSYGAIGLVNWADEDDRPGFNAQWYDIERPPYIICRFSPVLGPDNDPNGVEPDICWERIQEMSQCVFNRKNPGVNPKTGLAWTEAADWNICSERESAPRLGDFRYSQLYWVQQPYGFGLLGLGPSHPDPITGETLSGAAHIYAMNDPYSQGIADNALLLTRDLDALSYLNGFTTPGFNDNLTGPRLYSQTSPNTGYTLGQTGSMAGGMSANMEQPSEYSASSSAVLAVARPDQFSRVSNQQETVNEALLAANQYDYGMRNGDDFISYLGESDHAAAIEGALLNPNLELTMAAAMGINPAATDLTDDQLKDLMLVTRENPFKQQQDAERLRNLMSEKMAGCYWLADIPASEGHEGLAREIQRLKFKKLYENDLVQDTDSFRNAVWRMTRKKIMRAVVAHEIGHSIGLRHNFGGSQDHVNYREEYWDIRTNGCADASQDMEDRPVYKVDRFPDDWDEAMGCGNDATKKIGPRHVRDYDGDQPWDGDPISEFEIEKKIHTKAIGSIMDYAGNGHLDEYGVARYDWAALLFGYSNHLETYKEVPEGNWQVHDALRPGFISHDCELPPYSMTTDACRSIIIDDGALFDDTTKSGVVAGAIVINMATGEESTVASINGTQGYISLDTPFAKPMQVGQKYAVWGHPVGINDTEIKTGIDMGYALKKYAEGRGSPLILMYEYFFQPHYTEFYHNWAAQFPETPLGFNRQDNRTVEDARMFDWSVDSQGAQYDPGYTHYDDDFETNVETHRVPYVYCTDTHADISNDCNRHDYGTDNWERMHHHIVNWEYGYLGRSFPRGTPGYYINNYVGRNFGRTYMIPKNFNNIYVLYREIYGDLYDKRQIEAMLLDGWNSWGGYTMAMHDGFNMLMRTLATPDPMAKYGVKGRDVNGEWSMVGDVYFGQGDAILDVENGARVFETRFRNINNDDQCGENIFDCLWNVGWFWDKQMAIWTLTESMARFIGFDSSHDIRLYRISFFDNFNWQIKKYFGAAMGEKWNEWAPVIVAKGNPEEIVSDKFYPLKQDEYPTDNPWTGDGRLLTTSQWDYGKIQPKMYWRDWANPLADITNPTVLANIDEDVMPADIRDLLLDPNDTEDVKFASVDPMFRFTNQVYTMLYGMAFFQNNFDLSFYNSGRIWTHEGENPIGLDPDDIVEYFDPQSTMVYRAIKDFEPVDTLHPYSYVHREDDPSTPDIRENKEQGIAAQMIRFANTLRSRSSACDTYDLGLWAAPATTAPAPALIGDVTPAMFADDCCSNPYLRDPAIDDVASALGCAVDADCAALEVGTVTAYCDSGTTCMVTDACPFPPAYVAQLQIDDTAKSKVYGDPADWEDDSQTPVVPGDPEYDQRLVDSLNAWDVEHRKADEYLLGYRGLLDFVVKLSRVFDDYLGYI